MRKVACSFVCLLSIALLLCFAGSAGAVEYRALAIEGWHAGMWTQGEIDTMIHLAYDHGHYNVIAPQIRKKADALYVSHYGGPDGTGEPMYPGVPAGFDPLAYMIQEAHARGMQVHPWLCIYRCPTITSDWFYTSHYDWLTKTSTGALLFSEGWWLDPGVPDGEEYTVNVILDLVRNYDIDGIQWDRIRHAQQDSGYNAIALARFVSEYGYTPGYTDATFSNWRRAQVNGFISRVYAQIMEIKPNVVVGADTFADYNDAKTYRFQDWDAWMSNKWLDVNCPMNYSSNNDLYFDPRLQDALNRRYGRYVYTIHNIGAGTQANSVTQIAHLRAYEQLKGQPYAEQAYSYYHGTVTIPGWFDYVSASGRPYYSTDTIPTMPWKTSPTKGIMLGRVTDASNPSDPVYHNWVYKATVNLYNSGGSLVKTTTTDQTGYFVFTEVDPKLPGVGYTITVSKTGFTPQSYPDQAIAAGQVLRADFDLGPGASNTTKAISSPSGIVSPGMSLFSVPLQPVNPDPAVVLAGIPIHWYLLKWERATQSQIPYDEWQPDLFGNIQPDEGYWLFAENPYTISYTGYRGTPARNTSLPTAGWNIIGCPFERAVEWEDIMVVRNGVMVPMQNAAKDLDKLWLDSIGIWFDSATQSQYRIGIPDDYPDTTAMSPWHGYWVITHVDGLTMQLRLSAPE